MEINSYIVGDRVADGYDWDDWDDEDEETCKIARRVEG